MEITQITRKDIYKLFPDVLKDKRLEYKIDFVWDKNLQDNVEYFTGAKDKGGSWLCSFRILFQCLRYGKNGVVLRRHYNSHAPTVNEWRTRIIPLMEQAFELDILDRLITLPPITTKNFSGVKVFFQNFIGERLPQTISFLAYQHANDTSNYSNVEECFNEELISINPKADYADQLQVASTTLGKVWANFTRFKDKTKRTNIYGSTNPHDPTSPIVREFYEKALRLDLVENINKLKENLTLTVRGHKFLGYTWTIHQCSVFANYHFLSNEKIETLRNVADGDDEGYANFLIWGLPYDETRHGWLFLDCVNHIRRTTINDVRISKLYLGLDTGKLDMACLVVCGNNLYNKEEIVILKIITCANQQWDTPTKYEWILFKYLQWLKDFGDNLFKYYGYKIDINMGCDSYWVKDTLDNIIRNRIGMKINLSINSIGKGTKALMILQRNLTLKQKILNGQISYLDNSGIEAFIEQLKFTLYENERSIVEKQGNDIKDAFFYANLDYFKFEYEKNKDNEPLNYGFHKPTKNILK